MKTILIFLILLPLSWHFTSSTNCNSKNNRAISCIGDIYNFDDLKKQASHMQTCHELQMINLQNVQPLEFGQLSLAFNQTYTAWFNLKSLELNNFKLKTIDSLVNFAQLKNLSLPKNDLSSINVNDTFPTSLAHLNLSFNNLSSLLIHEHFLDLKTVVLSNNQINQIETRLPKTVEYLNLDSNNLEFLVRTLFLNLSQLKHLSLYNNRLRYVFYDYFFEPNSKLSHLNLGSNKIELFSVVKKESSLQFLNLSSNEIKTLNKDNFYKLDKLKHLDLSFNKIQEIDCLTLKKVNFIELSNNELKSVNQLIFESPEHHLSINLARNYLPQIPEISVENGKIVEYLGFASQKLSNVSVGRMFFDIAPENRPLNVTRLDLDFNDLASFSTTSLEYKSAIAYKNLHIQQVIIGKSFLSENAHFSNEHPNCKIQQTRSSKVHKEYSKFETSCAEYPHEFRFDDANRIEQLLQCRNQEEHAFKSDAYYCELALNEEENAKAYSDQEKQRSITYNENRMYFYNIESNEPEIAQAIRQKFVKINTFLIQNSSYQHFAYPLLKLETVTTKIVTLSFRNMRNLMQEMSNLTFLTELRNLSLRHNWISEIGDLNLPESLKYLYLDSNQLTSLDGINFHFLTNLQLLSLANNRFIYIELSALNQVKFLNLNSNLFSAFNLDSKSNLEFLDLSNNSLKLNEITSDRLVFLNLANNKLDQLQKLEIKSVNREIWLDLSNNLLTKAPKLNIPNNTVKFLGLKNNLISHLKNDFFQFESVRNRVENVDLRQNPLNGTKNRIFSFDNILYLSNKEINLALDEANSKDLCNVSESSSNSFITKLNVYSDFWLNLNNEHFYTSDLDVKNPGRVFRTRNLTKQCNFKFDFEFPINFRCEKRNDTLLINCQNHLPSQHLLIQLCVSKNLNIKKFHINNCLLENDEKKLNFLKILPVKIEKVQLEFLKLKNFRASDLGSMNDLLDLSLSHNSIQEIDFHFPNNMKRLNLSHNLLTRINETFFSNYFSDLEHLDLSNNKIEQMISNLTFNKLTFLNVEKNLIKNIEEIHFNIFNSNIELYLGWNNLTALPKLKTNSKIEIFSFRSQNGLNKTDKYFFNLIHNSQKKAIQIKNFDLTGNLINSVSSKSFCYPDLDPHNKLQIENIFVSAELPGPFCHNEALHKFNYYAANNTCSSKDALQLNQCLSVDSPKTLIGQCDLFMRNCNFNDTALVELLEWYKTKKTREVEEKIAYQIVSQKSLAHKVELTNTSQSLYETLIETYQNRDSFHYLEELSLAGNNLDTLKSFVNFSKLEKLTLTNNQLTLNVSSEKTWLLFPDSLTRLDLASNKIEKFRADFFSLNCNLKMLNLALNKLDSSQTFPNSLETLILDGNKFASIENSLSLQHLTKLKFLSIKNNSLKSIQSYNLFPDSLEKLFLDSNRIEKFSFNAFKVKDKIAHLSLSHNLLSKLDDNLQFSNLKFLYLERNLFEKLDNSFTLFASLEILDLKSNKLTVADDKLEFNKISKLDLSNNSLKQLKELVFYTSQPKIAIYLARNSLKRLPRIRAVHTDEIELIDLSAQKNFTALPVNFFHVNAIRNKLVKINKINLTENFFKTIDQDAFCYNTFEDYIYNDLKEVFFEPGFSLSQLDCSSNLNKVKKVTVKTYNFNECALLKKDCPKMKFENIGCSYKESEKHFDCDGEKVKKTSNLFEMVNYLKYSNKLINSVSLKNFNNSELVVDLMRNHLEMKKTVLSVENCRLKTINPIFVSQSIKEYNFRANSIVDLEKVNGLEEAVSLNLAYNQIKNWTDLTSLVNLKKLDLAYNLVDSLDSKNKLPSNLEHLSLEGNRLTFIDEAYFFDMIQLKQLILKKCNIKNLQVFLQAGTALEYIDLANNEFVEIPSISQNDARRTKGKIALNLAANRIRADVLKNSTQNLIVSLNLDNNSIDSIDGNFFIKFMNLKNVSLRHNKLRRVDTLNFLELASLDLSSNNLVELKEVFNFGQVANFELIVRDNFLTRLPFFKDCKSVKLIDMSYQFVRDGHLSLKEFFESIEAYKNRVVNISKIDLSNSVVKRFPKFDSCFKFQVDVNFPKVENIVMKKVRVAKKEEANEWMDNVDYCVLVETLKLANYNLSLSVSLNESSPDEVLAYSCPDVKRNIQFVGCLVENPNNPKCEHLAKAYCRHYVNVFISVAVFVLIIIVVFVAVTVAVLVKYCSKKEDINPVAAYYAQQQIERETEM